jgi:hypothetical protein
LSDIFFGGRSPSIGGLPVREPGVGIVGGAVKGISVDVKNRVGAWRDIGGVVERGAGTMKSMDGPAENAALACTKSITMRMATLLP